MVEKWSKPAKSVKAEENDNASANLEKISSSDVTKQMNTVNAENIVPLTITVTDNILSEDIKPDIECITLSADPTINLQEKSRKIESTVCDKPFVEEVDMKDQCLLQEGLTDNISDMPLSVGSIPHKKRHLLMAVDTASSSDGELAKTEETASQDDDGNFTLCLIFFSSSFHLLCYLILSNQ